MRPFPCRTKKAKTPTASARIAPRDCVRKMTSGSALTPRKAAFLTSLDRSAMNTAMVSASGKIISAERVSIVDVCQRENLGGLALDGWDWFGNRSPEFPRKTPLYISPKDSVGEARLNPWVFSNHPEPQNASAVYRIELNLWWAPARTDAVIHNTHDFLEIHTQIFGNGRIQIYRDRAGSRPYREISTAPGDTHDPIVRVEGLRSFRYPWHRGWTDEDCVWMAIELHPTSGR